MTVSLLAFAASARKDSLNKRLVRAAVASAERAGARVTLIDLNDYPMAVYHGDHEAAEGVPETSRPLRRLLREHDGLLVASPEYNGFVTPLLVNTLDWLSRKDGDESGLALFRGKYALLMGASPGPWGSMRALPAARQLLTNLGVSVLPDQLAVPKATEAFAPDGSLADEGHREKLDAMTARLVDTLTRLGGGS